MMGFATDSRAVFAMLKQHAFLLMPAGYVTVLVAWYAYSGELFQFEPGLTLLVVLPVAVVVGKTNRIAKELTPFVVMLLSYEALEGLADSYGSGPVFQLVVPATHNLVGIVQSTFCSPLVTMVTSLLYGLHFLLVAVLAVLLWYSDKKLYNRYVYSMLATSYLSLIVYVLMPSAPPWYTGVAMNLLQTPAAPGSSGFMSTLVNFGQLIESDKLAAFPSLHAAYITLFCYFTIRLKKIYGLVSVPITVGVLFSTIYLGQHFILDLVAGGAVAVVCVVVVTRSGLEHRNSDAQVHGEMPSIGEIG